MLCVSRCFAGKSSPAESQSRGGNLKIQYFLLLRSASLASLRENLLPQSRKVAKEIPKNPTISSSLLCVSRVFAGYLLPKSTLPTGRVSAFMDTGWSAAKPEYFLARQIQSEQSKKSTKTMALSATSATPCLGRPKRREIQKHIKISQPKPERVS